MIRIRLVLPVLTGLLVLFMTACDSTTSTVGIDLIEQGAAPVVREQTPSTFEEMPFNDVTGAIPRVLAGQVDDPLTGTVKATGYVDFISNFNTSDTTTIADVTLRLVPTYLYGDTLENVVLDVHDLTEDWDPVGAHADTTLSIGDLVTSTTFSPTDSIVTIPLPAAWVEANETTLRSSNFSALFNGFALLPSLSMTVVGFDASQSDMRVITAQDTFFYDLTRTLTGIERTSEPVIPEGRLLLQDGTGPFLKVNFDLAELEDTPLNGAIFRVYADTLTLRETPPNFVRPALESLQLVRILGESVAVVAIATRMDDGNYRFSDPVLNQVLQQSFFGNALFDHFEIRVSPSENSLSPTLLFDGSTEITAPKMLLTVTPTDS